MSKLNGTTALVKQGARFEALKDTSMISSAWHFQHYSCADKTIGLILCCIASDFSGVMDQVQPKEVMMRLSLLVATLTLASLAACTSAPKAPATPVQANQAQPAAQGDATADAPQARPRKKYMNTGSRLPSESPDADPSLGMPASGLSNTTSNTSGGSPH